MLNSQYKSRQGLLNELHSERQEMIELKKRLSKMERVAETQKYADLIIDNSPAILFRRLASEDLKKRRMVYVSPNISRFGYKAEDFISNKIMFSHIVNPKDKEQIRMEIQRYVNKNIESYTQTYRIITRDGDLRWVEDHTAVIVDPETGIRYHQGIVTDIHQRKEAEEKLRKSEEKYRQIVETTSEGFLYMDKGLFVVDVNNAYCRMISCSREELIGKNLIDMVTKEHRPFLSANRDNLLHRKGFEFESDLVASTGATVPVLIHGNTLYDDEGNIIGNMAFVTNMTEQKKSLTLASEVQKSLLPQSNLHVYGLDIAGRTIACDEIGGDYFDFLWGHECSDNHFETVVGDVTGHGVDAALLMMTARTFLRMRAPQCGGISRIITEMNQHLLSDFSHTDHFMTLFYASIDSKNQKLQWVRAGHDPAVIYDPAEDRFEELKGKGLALGLDESYEYEENLKVGLNPGQIIAIGTDGIWETYNSDRQMFGKQRFHKLIRENAHRSASEIIDAVFNNLKKFTIGLKQTDDITLVVIKVGDLL